LDSYLQHSLERERPKPNNDSGTNEFDLLPQELRTAVIDPFWINCRLKATTL
jgi:hypothetical protein